MDGPAGDIEVVGTLGKLGKPLEAPAGVLEEDEDEEDTELDVLEADVGTPVVGIRELEAEEGSVGFFGGGPAPIVVVSGVELDVVASEGV